MPRCSSRRARSPRRKRPEPASMAGFPERRCSAWSRRSRCIHAVKETAVQKQISIVNEKTGSVITTVGADVGPDQVVIRRLGWRRLEEAERARIKSSLQQVRELGGAAAVKEIQ